MDGRSGGVEGCSAPQVVRMRGAWSSRALKRRRRFSKSLLEAQEGSCCFSLVLLQHFGGLLSGWPAGRRSRLISLASNQLRRAGSGSGTTCGTLDVDTSLQVILNVFFLLFSLVSVVPPNISELKNLEVLNMFNNQIEELPTQISSLQKLKHLNLG